MAELKISRQLGVFMVVLASLLLIGCSAYQAPAIRVGSTAITQRTDEAVRLEVPIVLENPNSESLELLSYTYTVTVNGIRVYTGKRSAGAALGPWGTSHAVLPAVVRYDQVNWPEGRVPPGSQWSIQGRLLYVTPSELAEILMDLGLRRLTVPFSGQGELGSADGQTN